MFLVTKTLKIEMRICLKRTFYTAHTQANSIPKVNNTKVNSPREYVTEVFAVTHLTLYQGQFFILFSARNAKMGNSRVLA